MQYARAYERKLDFCVYMRVYTRTLRIGGLTVWCSTSMPTKANYRSQLQSRTDFVQVQLSAPKF